MQNLIRSAIIMLLVVFGACTGSKDRIDQDVTDIDKVKDVSIIILPFKYNPLTSYAPSDAVDIVKQSLQIAFMQKGYYVNAEDETVMNMLAKIDVNMLDEIQIKKLAIETKANLIIYGEILAFHESRGDEYTINFLIKAYDSKTNSIVLRERMSERYDQMYNPVTITRDMASEFVRRLELTGTI
jgi:hypothetical protein